ncbi:Dynein assembly factor with WDR repeat domains 1 [Geranomyces michiganensis]|nr:Dynein assembly factor with WDR repeat domains 1 [Geranomyces michiganensis]
MRELLQQEPMLGKVGQSKVLHILKRLRDERAASADVSAIRYDPHKKLRAHVMPLTNCAFNKSGSRAITGSYDRLCKVWDTSNGVELLTLEGHKNVVYSLAFNNPFGDKIATGSFDRTAKLWSTETGKCHHTFKGHTGEIVGVAFNPYSTLLGTASMDNTSMLWDVRTGSDVCRFKGHSGEVITISFSDCGKYMLTGSFDSTLNIWDVGTKRWDAVR